MNIRKSYALIVAAALLAAAVSPAAIAADLTDVGYIDQAAIGALPPFQKANAEMAKYQAQLQSQAATAMKKAKSDAQRQQLYAQFQQKFADRQRTVLGPLFARAQTAIAQVSSNKSLSVVVDKRIVIYGGQNITDEVVNLVKGPGAVVPPAATPPPSEIGFVDQQQIDQLPKVKQANDDYLKFANQQKQQAEKQMAAAKTNSDRQTIAKSFQKTLGDQQDKVLKPLVDRTKNAMADVAKKKNLILVVDKNDIIYGGTDITADVQSELK
ncbi:MAG TPA: OmpH family outer membrane protein [Candidatus Baltobacteraceae bacterium]